MNRMDGNRRDKEDEINLDLSCLVFQIMSILLILSNSFCALCRQLYDQRL
jgi:hypothetical protein